VTNSKKNVTRNAGAGAKASGRGVLTRRAQSNAAAAEVRSVKADANAPSEDVAIVVGKSEDGAGLQVLRKRADHVELGEVRPLEHGKPIRGEVVKLEQRGDTPVFDVKVQLSASELGPSALAGPAQVATDVYRRNWDAIWSQSSQSNRLGSDKSQVEATGTDELSSDDVALLTRRTASKKLLN
jgi:hypothetical protein